MCYSPAKRLSGNSYETLKRKREKKKQFLTHKIALKHTEVKEKKIWYAKIIVQGNRPENEIAGTEERRKTANIVHSND